MGHSSSSLQLRRGTQGQLGVQMWSPPPCLHPNHSEFLTQHLSWECGAGLAQQGTDKDVRQPCLVCSQSNTSLCALHVRGKCPSSGRKAAAWESSCPRAECTDSRDRAQGCSRKVESSRAGNAANVTWQCPDTDLAFSRVICHCQHCHFPTCEGQSFTRE